MKDSLAHGADWLETMSEKINMWFPDYKTLKYCE